jgi:hypothetical protein
MKNQTLTRIASEVLNLPTLTERGRDMLDFRDIHVTRLATALGLAYDAGRAAAFVVDTTRHPERPATHAERVALENAGDALERSAMDLAARIRNGFATDLVRSDAMSAYRELSQIVAILDTLTPGA